MHCTSRPYPLFLSQEKVKSCADLTTFTTFLVACQPESTRLSERNTLQGTNISPKNGILKMIFLLPRWDMLIPWRVITFSISIIIEVEPFYLQNFSTSNKQQCTGAPRSTLPCHHHQHHHALAPSPTRLPSRATNHHNHDHHQHQRNYYHNHHHNHHDNHHLNHHHNHRHQ